MFLSFFVLGWGSSRFSLCLGLFLSSLESGVGLGQNGVYFLRVYFPFKLFGFCARYSSLAVSSCQLLCIGRAKRLLVIKAWSTIKMMPNS